MPSTNNLVVRLLWFYLGLIILTLGYALTIRPGVGAAPWDIFHIGVHNRTGVPLGLVIQLTGVAIILLNWSLQIKPGLGMLLNMLSVGPMMQAILSWLPLPQTPVGQWLMLGTGILVVGFGTALYVSADLGSGPRDGMMIGLTRKLGLPVAVIKNGIDATVAFTGWLLGGPLGLGTVLVALTLGPSMQLGMHLVERISRLRPFSTFVRPVALKRS